MELGISILERKAEMYEMIMALEQDFISNFYSKLSLNEISTKIIEKSNRTDKCDEFLSVLEGLDIQAYIEICNENVLKLKITKEQKDYLNKDFCKLIPIRNNVMHPRPLGVFDYPILKEAFNSVDKYISQFEWKNVGIIKEKILKNPETLKLPPNLRKSENIIENLPTVNDFEETSFIGRNREIGEIKAKLHKKNVHILSIIGDGGVGKTALTVKLLYDILDDNSFKYELILWISLKTNSLNDYEFSEIKNSINTTSKMYNELKRFVGNDTIEEVPSYLISLAQEFNTLLVLDNLETINSSEIKEFLEDFTEYGQVLITSRIGLGEMEHRYKLEGFIEKDLMEYINTLLQLYGLEGMLSDDEKKNIAIKELYSNPLAIKWFVRCLYNGKSVSEILKNKDDLTNFCMSNVYEKLSKLAQDILDVLIVAGREITFAEVMYYLDNDDYTEVSRAVNDLIKCNFIDDKLFRESKKLAITLFAKDYLKTLSREGKAIISSFMKKDAELQSFGQSLIQCMQEEPYTLKSIYVRNNDTSQIVSAYYLKKAIKCSYDGEIDQAHNLVEYAKKLSPNYFECNKVNAFIYSTTSQTKAIEEYEIALSICESDEEKERMHIIYAGFLLRCNDYLKALNEIEKAEKINNKNTYVLFEKSKIFACINRFDDSEKVLRSIDYTNLSQKNKNKYLTRWADLFKRKSEHFDQRITSEKFELIKQAFEYLEKSEQPDDGIYDYIAILLKSLAYIFFDNDILSYILEKLKKYYPYIRKRKDFKEFQNKMRSKLHLIDNTYIRERFSKYVIDINEQLSSLRGKQGIVYKVDREKDLDFLKTKHI